MAVFHANQKRAGSEIGKHRLKCFTSLRMFYIQHIRNHTPYYRPAAPVLFRNSVAPFLFFPLALPNHFASRHGRRHGEEEIEREG